MSETTQTVPIPAIRKYATFALPLALLVVFYAVGFWGLALSEARESFQRLTPLNLLLTNALLFSFHRGWSGSYVLFALLVFLCGFLSEVIGVHTGLLFGSYSYGETLGFKLWEVPLLIGLNWLMLVYTTGHISNLTRLPWVVKALLGASLMVLLDFFIEPVAMQYDFWSWRGGEIPLSNFIGWFAVAFMLQLYFQKANFRKENKLAPFVYLLQLLFFVGLWCFL
ncbi:putative membrane protein [Pontibacter ummariensis]|uniref:Putative membrane protein n=1 Tax=Pontibacter ummariensis TaxID=1610492 RepID=A0A239CNH9_9BACT|nr:carotenoid biosynthesis protein [Pontibacter ummariensis]PRY14944.1 putative membrane protein [Pontibacter ummariensis]SNS21044.1 putative membrane protein [Pontibacter ummariensis]